MDTPCRCGGMNEECIFCGGSGVVREKKPLIVKTTVNKSALKKENAELQAYLHPKSDDLYANNYKPKKRKNKPPKKRKTVPPEKPVYTNIKKAYISNATISFKKTKSQKKGKAKQKPKENEVYSKGQNSDEFEFYLFWENHIKSGTKDNIEFKECLALFLRLPLTKREKFKFKLSKNYSDNANRIVAFAREIFEKLNK